MRNASTSAIVALVTAASACAAPPIAPPLQPAGISASFGKTWNAVVDVLAERNIPVKTMDRSSGFVSAELASISATDFDKLANCGSTLSQLMTGSATADGVARYNILVRGDSTTSTVKVTARFVKGGDTAKECPSNNVFEGQFQTEVKGRAEGHQ